jgi:hypothetical protein
MKQRCALAQEEEMNQYTVFVFGTSLKTDESKVVFCHCVLDAPFRIMIILVNIYTSSMGYLHGN